MQRNEETLSTRDLASANDPATGAATASDSAAETDEQLSAAPATVYDREAPDRDVTDRDVTDREAIDREAIDREAADREAAPGARLGADTPSRDTEFEPAAAAPGRGTAPASPAGAADSASDNGAPLLTDELSSTFQRRWEEVQTRFVDEPRGAVEEADGLVANLMQQLAEGFAQERERLEAQWGRGEDISTEDLRIALQRYRSFFQRLLTT